MDEGGMMNGAASVNGAGGVVGGAGNATVASPVQVPNGPEMPQMAEMNLMPQKNVFVKNKKLWLAVGGAVLALILVVVGVVGVVKGRGDGGEVDNENQVALDYKPEGYGGDPTDSTVAAVFGDKVWSKYYSDEEYTYDDAIVDYETAYEETGEELRFEILLLYADFVLMATNDVDSAVEVLSSHSEILKSESYIAQYYTTIISMYNNSGQYDKAEYYMAIFNELMQAQME